MSQALPFLAIAGLIGVGAAVRALSCQHCGGSLATGTEDPKKLSISDSMYERRFLEPALFLRKKDIADRIADRWKALQPEVEIFIQHPERLSEDAMKYGVSKEYYSEQRSRRTGKEKKDAVTYAAEWQIRQKLASEFVPDDLIVPCGKKGSLEDLLLGPRFDIAPEFDPDKAELRLVIRERSTGDQVWIFGTDRMGALFWEYGLPSANLFTATSKMGAPSFSLPAGKPGEGGTCTAAGYAPDPGDPGDEEEGIVGANPIFETVCASCYALKGHYGYLSNIVPGLVRKAWVERHLRADPSGATLGDILAEAIEAYARRAHLKDGPKRSAVELGVWTGEVLAIPPRGPRSRKTADETVLDAASAKVLGVKAGTTTDQARKRAHVPRGAVAGFFRIHDSGDFSVSGRTSSYAAAWARVAALLPHVQFWAPTRVYVFEKKDLPALQKAAASAPDNLSIRPSAILVNERPPRVPGLAAGTGVNTASVDLGTPQRPVWQCPVYSKVVLVGGKMKEAKSCVEAGCRVCWLAKAVPVTYGKH